MNAAAKNDQRVALILDQARRLAALCDQRVDASETSDHFDIIRACLDRVGRFLEGAHHVATKSEQRIRDHRLRDSEAQLQTIFDNAPDAVVVIDSHNRIIRWNPAATGIFGWAEEEVTGKILSDILVPERYRDRHIAGIRRFLETGEGKILNRTIQLQGLCKNGSEIEIELTVSPARTNDGYLFISFLRDISGRKKTEEQLRQLNATLEERVLERTEQLNLTEAKYKQLFENNPMPLWVLDKNSLRFLDVNESAIQLYGYTREEFLSMISTDIRPEQEKSRYLALNRGTLGTQNTGVWTHVKKNGGTIQCEVMVHEMLFEGRPARLVLANDVTEKMRAHHELQVSEARFRQLFNSKITGFSFWDEDGKVTDANDLFLDMLGYGREDLAEGRIHLQELTPPEFHEVTLEARRQIKTSGVCEPFEKEYLKKDGTRLPVIIGSASINDDNSSVAGVSCVMDISQRKKMEMQIVALNRDLEVKVNERTQALQAVNKELEAFTYSVSHDLRSPLRAIHGYSQMLSEDYEGKLDQEAGRLLNAIKHNAKHMGQLVNDLLAFSRMGKRPLTQTETDLDLLVGSVLADISEAEPIRAKVKIHRLGMAKADEHLLRQAFHNLISNALKYSSKIDDPQVEIGKSETTGEVTYFVKDNGVGFDMAYYKKLFGVFQRLHAQEEFEGTGVGLAIVQRIVQRHGGKIWAEAKVGEGAIFYFTLGNKRQAKLNIPS